MRWTIVTARSQRTVRRPGAPRSARGGEEDITNLAQAGSLRKSANRPLWLIKDPCSSSADRACADAARRAKHQRYRTQYARRSFGAWMGSPIINLAAHRLG